jgi:uncharacterized RDD family membrane protein YckC
MYTVDEYRSRYTHLSSEELLSLLAIEPEQLTPEARQALTEETERRGLTRAEALAETSVIPVRPDIAVVNFHYPKAPLMDRFGAYLIDGAIGLGPLAVAGLIATVLHWGLQSPTTALINLAAGVAWALYYGLTKDARPNGQSVGKKAVDLMVVDVETNKPCLIGQSMGRALVLVLLDVIPFVGWLIEPVAVLWSDKGRRIGDQAAGTQVIRKSDYVPNHAIVLNKRVSEEQSLDRE